MKPTASSKPSRPRAAASQGEGVVTLAAPSTAHHEPVDGRDVPATGGRPPLLTFGASHRSLSLPALDAYALRLVSSRSLYDGGATLQHCPSLAHLGPGPRVRVNPHDLERLGLASGDRVRMVSSRATIELPVTAWRGVPRGSISITFNQPGNVSPRTSSTRPSRSPTSVWRPHEPRGPVSREAAT